MISLALLTSELPDRPAATARLTGARDLVETLQGLGLCDAELRTGNGEREIAAQFLRADKKP